MSKKQQKGHKRDTRNLLKPYTIPVIKKDNPDKWFISYTYVVPGPLQKYADLHPRKIERFKVYQGINRVRGEEREKLANELRDALEVALKTGLLNPYEKELEALEKATVIKKQRIEEAALTEEQQRKLLLTKDVLELFMQSRRARKLEGKSVSAYQNAINWMVAGFGEKPLAKVSFIDVQKALEEKATAKDWTANTINNQFNYAMTVFIWAVTNEYLVKNPLINKWEPLPVKKSINKWYDRETAAAVKKELEKIPWLKHVCQFTYWILIRSKKELQAIKIGDIDFDLHQVKFRKEWTKNDTDQNRDYGPEFAKVLDEMGLRNLPKDWYIFGENAQPGPNKCGHNYFSRFWARIRTKLKLSEDYTIYGWKHTRIVHMMMLGISSYDIAHAARHGNTKTTEDYKRDYDISLAKVYGKDDLTF